MRSTYTIHTNWEQEQSQINGVDVQHGQDPGPKRCVRLSIDREGGGGVGGGGGIDTYITYINIFIHIIYIWLYNIYIIYISSAQPNTNIVSGAFRTML